MKLQSEENWFLRKREMEKFFWNVKVNFFFQNVSFPFSLFLQKIFVLKVAYDQIWPVLSE